ncbi:hypothetical protein A5641_15800 [Mycobacterium sp. 1554424.7]|nr:hypothetical protein A5641_15800 [Mycobacterium sp. 1554424.7]
MLKRLSALPIDSFLLALAATVGLAALLPAHGEAADAVSAAAKAAIALLFFLYGARRLTRVGALNDRSSRGNFRPRRPGS